MPMINDNQGAIELLTEVFSWHITSISLADAGYRGELGDYLYLTHQCRIGHRQHLLGNRGLSLSHCAGLWSAPFLGSIGFAD